MGYLMLWVVHTKTIRPPGLGEATGSRTGRIDLIIVKITKMHQVNRGFLVIFLEAQALLAPLK
jgi:hypothetical protein